MSEAFPGINSTPLSDQGDMLYAQDLPKQSGGGLRQSVGGSDTEIRPLPGGMHAATVTATHA